MLCTTLQHPNITQILKWQAYFSVAAQLHLLTTTKNPRIKTVNNTVGINHVRKAEII